MYSFKSETAPLSFKAVSAIHARSFKNASLLKLSKDAACFGCISKFPATSVSKFSKVGHAHCPRCNQQTVVGDTLVQGNFAIRTTLERKHMVEVNETYDLRFDFQKNNYVPEFVMDEE